jgi:hypothetical protein
MARTIRGRLRPIGVQPTWDRVMLHCIDGGQPLMAYGWAIP